MDTHIVTDARKNKNVIKNLPWDSFDAWKSGRAIELSKTFLDLDALCSAKVVSNFEGPFIPPDDSLITSSVGKNFTLPVLACLGILGWTCNPEPSGLLASSNVQLPQSQDLGTSWLLLGMQ